jgi:hypothetical protein
MEALMTSSQGFNFVQEYWIDAWQRSVLMLDVLRERRNTHLQVVKRLAPHALTFKFEVVRDGRSLPRPVNHGLTYAVPPDGTTIDPAKPPFVVVDPRAGHGPGIGGMKRERTASAEALFADNATGDRP